MGQKPSPLQGGNFTMFRWCQQPASAGGVQELGTQSPYKLRPRRALARIFAFVSELTCSHVRHLIRQQQNGPRNGWFSTSPEKPDLNTGEEG
jgi:hypothetical protein